MRRFVLALSVGLLCTGFFWDKKKDEPQEIEPTESESIDYSNQFFMPKINNYTLFLTDDPNDSIEVCCKYDKNNNIIYADYSQIKTIIVYHPDSLGTVHIIAYKWHSAWQIWGTLGKPETWTVSEYIEENKGEEITLFRKNSK